MKKSDIQNIDEKIIELLKKRIELVSQTSNAVEQANILQKLAAQQFSHSHFSRQQLREIVKILNQVCSHKYSDSVGYLAPEWSFSYQAGLEHFQGSVDLTPVDSIERIFKKVKEETINFGIIPIENSYSGNVLESIHFLGQGDVQVVAEVYLKISFCLCSFADSIQEISTICSKDIAIRQCSGFLNENFKAPNYKYVDSTSKAAETIQKYKDSGTACICSTTAAKRYNLKILENNIQNSKYNTTRFLIISSKGNQSVTKKTSDINYKSSLIANLDNKAGALFEFLKDFKNQKINLVKIDSRPLGNFEKYLFLIDIDGHFEDENVVTILEKYKDEIKFLGSYKKMSYKN